MIVAMGWVCEGPVRVDGFFEDNSPPAEFEMRCPDTKSATRPTPATPRLDNSASQNSIYLQHLRVL